MDAILNFVQHLDFDTITTDPRVMIGAGIVLVLAIIFRWKAVLLLFFGVGGTMAVVHYSHVTESSGAAFDRGLIFFVVGCVVVGVVLIYFLFIRGD